jgi:hypothetical protein
MTRTLALRTVVPLNEGWVVPRIWGNAGVHNKKFDCIAGSDFQGLSIIGPGQIVTAAANALGRVLCANGVV